MKKIMKVMAINKQENNTTMKERNKKKKEMYIK